MAQPSPTGSGGYNAGDETNVQSLLFPDRTLSPGVGPFYSHTFQVKDAMMVVRAYGLNPDDRLCIEMVFGCNEGTLFEPLTIGGHCACICCGNSTIVIPYEGRYRAVLTGTVASPAEPDNVTVTAIPSSIPFDAGSILAMACGCPPVLVGTDVATSIANDPVAVGILCAALAACIAAAIPAGHVPATMASGDGVVVPTASGVDNQTFTLNFNPTVAAAELAGDAGAVGLLCAALTPCIIALAPAGHSLATLNTTTPQSLFITASGPDFQDFNIDFVGEADDIPLSGLLPQFPAALDVQSALNAINGQLWNVLIVTDTFGVPSFKAFNLVP